MKFKCIAAFGVVFSLTVWANTVLAQTFAPAMEYSSMMNVRFYEATGGFLIETLPVFFPPDEMDQFEFEITNTAGDVKFSKGVYPQPFQQLPVVDGIRPQGGGMVSGLPAGDYRFSVKASGQEITSIAFSIKTIKSDDPFNPQTKLTREGPWSVLGYLSASAESPEEAMNFNWWSRAADLPDGKGGKVVVEILKDGQMIADSKGFFVSKEIWQSCGKQLRKADSGGRQFFTMADLCSQNGSYLVVIRSGEKTIRTYEAVVAEGKLQHHLRSAMGYEPQIDYIVPKVVVGQAGNGSGRKMIDAYWMDAQ